MSEQEIYLASRQSIITISNQITETLLRYMALVRLVVLFIASLPLNILLFTLTHLLVLLVSVLQDVALLSIKLYLDFMREARRATL